LGGGPAPSRPGDLQPKLVLYSAELRAAVSMIADVCNGWKADLGFPSLEGRG